MTAGAWLAGGQSLAAELGAVDAMRCVGRVEVCARLGLGFALSPRRGQSLLCRSYVLTS